MCYRTLLARRGQQRWYTRVITLCLKVAISLFGANARRLANAQETTTTVAPSRLMGRIVAVGIPGTGASAPSGPFIPVAPSITNQISPCSRGLGLCLIRLASSSPVRQTSGHPWPSPTCRPGRSCRSISARRSPWSSPPLSPAAMGRPLPWRAACSSSRPIVLPL